MKPRGLFGTAVRAGALIGGLRTAFKRPSSTVTMPRISAMTRPRYRLRRGRTRTRVIRRKPRSETAISYAAYTRGKYRRGRRLRRNVRGAWRVIKNSTENRTYQTKVISTFAGTSGSLYLGNIQAAPGGTNTIPLHLWELTSSPNWNGVSNDVPQVGWFPSLSNETDTGLLSWTQAYTHAADSAPVSAAQIAAAPLARDMLEWVSVKLLFYAPLQIASRIQIDLVQISDTRLVPTSGAQTAFHTSVYQDMVKRFMYSPLEYANAKSSQYFKVLDSKSFIMEPKETTEPVNTNMREVNLFYRLNRRQNYKWEDQDRVNMQTADSFDMTGSVKTQVHPRARMFLMIRGQANLATTASNTLHPSYDIHFRTKHSQLS